MHLPADYWFFEIYATIVLDITLWRDGGPAVDYYLADIAISDTHSIHVAAAAVLF